MTKKELSWAMYDWANSVFFTTVVAGFFPVFFKKYWSTEGTVLDSTARLGVVLTISGFLIAISSPLLGVLSDYRRFKKKFLFMYTILGSLATVGLYFVPQGDWSTAALLYGIALFFCSAGSVYYDSLLVSVTRSDRFDKISSYGYAMGYLGGAILFIFNLMMYQNPSWFGITDGTTGVRLSFITVGIWWTLFSLPLMFNVPEPDLNHEFDRIPLGQLLSKSVSELNKTFLEIFKNKNLFYFVLAYWFYIDGVGTVISMAVDFGMSLDFDSGDLIKALLLTQIVGFPAAFIVGKWASVWGNKRIILFCIFLYSIIVVGASLMSSPVHFFILAAVIGCAQGGIQALSRSFFAQLVPREKSGEYFGFFNLLGKFASIVGPLLMAIAARMTNQPQYTILSLLILFVMGFYFLLKVKNPQQKPQG